MKNELKKNTVKGSHKESDFEIFIKLEKKF